MLFLFHDVIYIYIYSIEDVPGWAFRRLELCEAEAPRDAILLDRKAPGNYAFDLSKEVFHLEARDEIRPEMAEIPTRKDLEVRYFLQYWNDKPW